MPDAQSVFVVHEVKQAVGPHAYRPQDLLAGLQVPAPSQVLTCFSMPPAHEGEPHDFVVAAYLHTLPSVPSQLRAHAGSLDVPLHGG